MTLSADLLWRVVRAWWWLGSSLAKAAQRFEVSYSAAKEAAKRFKQGRPLSLRRTGGDFRGRLMGPQQQTELRRILETDPTLYLSEVREELALCHPPIVASERHARNSHRVVVSRARAGGTIEHLSLATVLNARRPPVPSCTPRKRYSVLPLMSAVSGVLGYKVVENSWS